MSIIKREIKRGNHGDYLLSRPKTLSSALEDFTSVVGMGTGGTLPV